MISYITCRTAVWLNTDDMIDRLKYDLYIFYVVKTAAYCDKALIITDSRTHVEVAVVILRLLSKT